MIENGEVKELYGKKWTMVGDSGIPGLFFVCETDNPNAQPILRDEKWWNPEPIAPVGTEKAE